MLGDSRVISIHSQTVIVATGNTTRVTGEIGKRTVPIQLQPGQSNPEARTEFYHPDLRAYVRERRSIALSALVGAVRLWQRAGSPPGTLPLGGFDEWARAVGGILGVLGYQEWMQAALAWRIQADDFTGDLERLVGAWIEHEGSRSLSAAELTDLAKANQLFEWVFMHCKKPEHEPVKFSLSVMRKALKRVILGKIVQKDPYGSHSRYILIDNPANPATTRHEPGTI